MQAEELHGRSITDAREAGRRAAEAEAEKVMLNEELKEMIEEKKKLRTQDKAVG